MELDLSMIETAADALGPVQAPVLSSYPIAVQDVALVVPESVPAADVERALTAGAAGAGDVQLESLNLFDVYTGDQVGEGRKSLAYTLRFRAPDRTLTAEEVNAARDAAVGRGGSADRRRPARHGQLTAGLAVATLRCEPIAAARSLTS